MRIIKILIIISLISLQGCAYAWISKEGRHALMIGEGEFQPGKKIKCDYDFSLFNFRFKD